MKQMFWTLILLAFIPFSTNGQKTWTLQECIETAKSQNLQVRRQQLQIEAARSNLAAARASALPGLSGWATHNYSSGKTVNFEDYSYINTQYQDGNLGLQASLPLFQGLQGYHRIRQQKFAMLSAEEQTAALELNITIQAITGYLQVLLNEELLKIAQEKYASGLEQVRRAEEFYEAGKVARAEVLQMKSQSSADQLSLTTAKGNLDMAYLALRQLMNLDGNEALVLQKTRNDRIVSPLPLSGDVFALARTHQPRIKAAQWRLQSAEAGLNSLWGSVFPSFSLDGFVYSRYSELGVNPLNPSAAYPYGEQLKDNSYGRLSMNINIPIFSQLTRRNQINQAKVQVMDSRLQLEQEHRLLREEIERASAEAASAQARLNAANEAVLSAGEAYMLVEEQFNNGLVTSVDLKVSGAQFVTAQANQLQAKYELLLRAAILDLYLERPLQW